MKEEDAKLIIFGWIVTILGIEPDVAKHEEWRLKTNALTDKLYEIMQFRSSEPLQAVEIKKRESVRLENKNPSESLYEAQTAK